MDVFCKTHEKLKQTIYVAQAPECGGYRRSIGHYCALHGVCARVRTCVRVSVYVCVCEGEEGVHEYF